MSDHDPEKKPAPPTDSESQSPAPLPLNYYDPTLDRSSLETVGLFLGGMLAGSVGLGIAMLFCVVGSAINGSDSARITFLAIDLMIGIISIYKLVSESRTQRRPFMLGLMAGVCLTVLLEGICFSGL